MHHNGEQHCYLALSISVERGFYYTLEVLDCAVFDTNLTRFEVRFKVKSDAEALPPPRRSTIVSDAYLKLKLARAVVPSLNWTISWRQEPFQALSVFQT